MCGAVDVSQMAVSADAEDFVAASELAALKIRQASMEAEITELRGLVDRLYAELGVGKTGA
jgi:alanine racemase